MRVSPMFAALFLVAQGSLNPAVTQATIHKTICVKGWTETVRPPLEWSHALKIKLIQDGKHPGTISDYELDHFIPLELGGCAKCKTNLWLQPWGEASIKDLDENRLHDAVCAGSMTLKAAREEMRSRWRMH